MSNLTKSLMSSPEMEAGIWSTLPEELLERILSMLPLKTFMVLRSTCKHFKSLLFSPTFISNHSVSSSSSSSPFSSFILLSHPQCYPHFPLFDSPLGAWRSFSPPLSEFLPRRRANGHVALVAISHGLLCFSTPSSSSFVICNVLTKSSKVIKFPTHPFAFELLTLVATPIGFNIFLLSSGCSTKTRTYVYDSKLQSWRSFVALDTILSDNQHQQGVHFKGCLYFSTPEPFSLVKFDMQSCKWARDDSAELPAEIVFVRLVSDEAKGKMYMIGGIGSNGISRSMRIWEMCEEEEEGKKRWVEIERVPEMMCRKIMTVCYHNYEHLYCFLHQGLICVCCYAWPEILYYKVSRRSWHWLPRSPSVPEKSACGFKWFSFVPELNASV